VKIKRYFAQDMRQAIRKVRDAQGPDAVILSNRKVDGGVEIVAAVDYDESLFTTAPEAAVTPNRTDAGARPAAAGAPAVSAPKARQPEVVWSQEPAITAMREELHSIRGLLESQLSGLAWGELGRRQPERAALLRQLMELDLSPALAREIAAQVPRGKSLEEGWRKALGLLAHRIRVSDDDIVNNGGVVALVGPTGVGKTTTVAKLAARFTLRHGPGQVALVTTDSYRVGAVEQLRTYGRIMGIPVRVTTGPEDLHAALEDLYDRRLVLVDTAGMSQRDIRLSEQLAMIRSGSPLVQSYLVLAATAQTRGLEEVVKAFQGINPDGCVITKVDEAGDLGGVLSVVIQYNLLVAYVSEGQRVPEDLRPARAHNLVSQAVTAMKKRARSCDDETLELSYGAMVADGRF